MYVVYTTPHTWTGIYSVADCLPVRQTISRGIEDAIVTSFRNVTLGIKDLSVFIPPEYCQTPLKRIRQKVVKVI
jgi:hypothetical protein